MEDYIRSWDAPIVNESGVLRWNLRINDQLVPGGYVLKLMDEYYEAHYPHMETQIEGSLEEAQVALELLPVITRGEFDIARPVKDPGDELIAKEEAARLLGVSVPRINAMIINGVLEAKKVDGSHKVSKKTVEHQLSNASDGPVGRFANRYLFYRSQQDPSQPILIEIPGDDADKVSLAERFAAESSKPIKAEFFSFFEARTLFPCIDNQPVASQEQPGVKIVSFDEFFGKPGKK